MVSDLVMLDETNKEDKSVTIILSNDCMFNGNVVIIPLNEALSIVANITIQAATLV